MSAREPRTIGKPLGRVSWPARVYAMVRRVPRGHVATYGQIATLLGVPRGGRAVGWALSACDDAGIPCHRVVYRDGRTAPRFRSQRARLEDEGVRFVAGRVDLARSRWSVGAPGPARA